jgi:hypothetical protein
MAETNPFMNLGEEEVSPSDNPFMNLGEEEVSSSDNPFMNLGEEKKPYKSPISSEFQEGVNAGIINIGTSVATLATSAVDLLAGTDFTSKVNNISKGIKEDLGINPEGFVGKGAEVVTQFVAPVGIGVSMVKKGYDATTGIAKTIANRPKIADLTSAFSKTGKRKASASAKEIERVNRGIKQIAVGTAIEGVVSGDDTESIGDWVEMGPTQTHDLIGLTGRKLALERLLNRGKIMAEGGGLGASIEGGLSVLRSPLSSAGQATAKAINNKLDAAGSYLDDLTTKRMIGTKGTDQEITGFKNYLARTAAMFRPRGFLPTGADQSRYRVAGQVDAVMNEGEKLTTEGLKILDELEKNGSGTFNKVNVMNKVDNYLRGETPDGVSLSDLKPDINARPDLVRKVDLGDGVTYTPETLKKAAEETSILTMKDIKPQFRNNPALKDILNVRSPTDKAMKAIGEIDSILDEIAKSGDFNKYKDMVSKNLLDQIPKELRSNARRMKESVRKQSKLLKDSGIVGRNNYVTTTGEHLNEVLERGQHGFLRRSYEIHSNAKYKPTKEVSDAARDYFKKNTKFTEKILSELKQADTGEVLNDAFMVKNGLSSDGLGGIKVSGRVTDEAARLVEQKYLSTHRPMTSSTQGGRVAIDRIDAGLLTERKNIDKTLRRLLGEVEDPYQAYLKTISDIAQFNAVDDYFSSIARMSKNQQGVGKFFKDPLDPQADALVASGKWVRLGEDGAAGVKGEFIDPSDPNKMVTIAGKEQKWEDVAGKIAWGDLDGYLVPKDIYNDLTRTVWASDNTMGNAIRGLYGAFLKGKGISQYSKTILSPITQVRNFSTAVAFALANGNVPVFGKGDASFKDSLDLVMADIRKAGDDAVYEDLMDAQRRGIMGTNAELREIQDTLNINPLSAKRTPDNFVETITGKLGDNAFARGTKGFLKGAEKVYQSSDDFWKYYNYRAEVSKLKSALGTEPNKDLVERYLLKGEQPNTVASQLKQAGKTDEYFDELLKNRAAQIVQDTVPNYNKSSEFLRGARRLPVGNFITFPVEIYRTGFGIIKQSLDDMASEIPAIQMKGRNRMLSALATWTAIPIGTAKIGYAISGVSEEEMDAYKRSFAPRWEQGALLIPTGRTKDGKITYINFSTSNPYDSLTRFANRATFEYDKARAEGKDVGETLLQTGFATFAETIEPFMSEAMLTESMIDSVFRGGRTATGAEIFNPQDPWPTKVIKGIVHSFDTLIPTGVPVQVSGGKLQPDRFGRGLIDKIGGEDGTFLGMTSEDKMGNQRTFEDEMIRQFSGISNLEFDPKRSLRYKARSFQRAQTDAKRMFNTVTDDFNATSDSLEEAFEKANNTKLRVDKQYYQLVEDIRTLGLSDREQKKLFKTFKIGGVKGILKGRFEPFTVSDDNIAKMKRAGIYDEYRNIRLNIKQIQRDMKGLSLAPDNVSRSSAPAPDVNPFMNLS